MKAGGMILLLFYSAQAMHTAPSGNKSFIPETNMIIQLKSVFVHRNLSVSSPNLLKDERIRNLLILCKEQYLADNLRGLRIVIHKRKE